MRLWRSHPVLFAALVGGIVGLGNVLAIEIPALLGKPSHGALSLLQPSRPAAVSGILQTAFILLIEVAANVLAYALIFALLGGLFLALRRTFRRSPRRSEP